MAPPEAMHWLFWDVDPEGLDLERDADYVLGRVLERGRLADIRWTIQSYGLDAIRRFLRDAGHPELSPRTIAFWRALMRAGDEPWRTPPGWRRTSSVPWHD